MNSELDPDMCQRVIINFVTRIKAIVSVAEVDTCLILYYIHKQRIYIIIYYNIMFKKIFF